MAQRRPWGLAVAALVAVACSKDVTGPAQKLAGTYSYTATFGGSGGSCSVNEILTIKPQGAAFSGSYSGNIICTDQSGSHMGQTSGSVMNGSVSGDSVYFDFDGSAWHNFGVVDGTGMRGTANAQVVVNGAPNVLAGDFVCTKQ